MIGGFINKSKISDRNVKEVEDFLNKEESVLIDYSPKFSLINIFVFVILGYCIILGFFLELMYLEISKTFFISEGFFIFSIVISLIFLFFCGIFSPILLSKIKFNKSKYIFTNKQIIIKFSGKFYFTPLENIKTIQSLERKDYYLTKILLKTPMHLRHNPEKIEIRFPIVPKDIDTLEKISSIK
ncbi:MAG: hypothetical protein ACFFHD_13740 [Promethearchaeota archaeon]